MVQQGPQSSEEIKAKIAALRARIQSGTTPLAGIEDLEDQVSYVRMLAGTNGLTLNNNQIKLILQQQSSTVDEIMKEQTIPANPNTRLAIQIILATAAAAILKPGIPASALSNFALRQSLHGLFDQHLALYKPAIDLAITVATLALSDYGLGTGWDLHSLSNAAITQLEETYGRGMVTLAIPAAMILYSKGPAILAAIADSETVEVTGDFFDLMHGRADDDVYEKYKGSIATMTIDEVASGAVSGVGRTLSWLWNKVPSLRSQAPTLLALPDAPSTTASTTSSLRN